MRKNFSKIFIFMVTFIVLIYIVNFFNDINIKTYKPWMKTKFCKVKDTGYYNTVTSEQENKNIAGGKNLVEEVQYNESYVIINAPNNTEDLKKEILNFEEKNPIKVSNYVKCDMAIRKYYKEDREMYKFEKEWDCESTLEERFASYLTAYSKYSKYKNETKYKIRPLNSKFEEVDEVWFSISN